MRQAMKGVVAEVVRLLRMPELSRVLLHVAVVLSFATVAQAGGGQVMRLPRPGPNASGLVLRVDPQWVEASGYRNVRIHLSTATGAATPRDRNLRIELSPNYSGQGRRS